MTPYLVLMMMTLHNRKYDNKIILDNVTLRAIQLHLELLMVGSSITMMKLQLQHLVVNKGDQAMAIIIMSIASTMMTGLHILRDIVSHKLIFRKMILEIIVLEVMHLPITDVVKAPQTIRL